MKYQLKQETKPTLKTYGKYKAVAVHGNTVDTHDIISEICQNNPISEGAVVAVLSQLSAVVSRHLRRGDRVRLDDLGLLKLEIESDKVDTAEAFRPAKHIRGVRLHFLPKSSGGKPKLYQDIRFERAK